MFGCSVLQWTSKHQKLSPRPLYVYSRKGLSIGKSETKIKHRSNSTFNWPWLVQGYSACSLGLSFENSCFWRWGKSLPLRFIPMMQDTSIFMGNLLCTHLMDAGYQLSVMEGLLTQILVPVVLRYVFGCYVSGWIIYLIKYYSIIRIYW